MAAFRATQDRTPQGPGPGAARDSFPCQGPVVGPGEMGESEEEDNDNDNDEEPAEVSIGREGGKSTGMSGCKNKKALGGRASHLPMLRNGVPMPVSEV